MNETNNGQSGGQALPRVLDILALIESKAHIHATRISTPLQIIRIGKKKLVRDNALVFKTRQNVKIG